MSELDVANTKKNANETQKKKVIRKKPAKRVAVASGVKPASSETEEVKKEEIAEVKKESNLKSKVDTQKNNVATTSTRPYSTHRTHTSSEDSRSRAPSNRSYSPDNRGQRGNYPPRDQHQGGYQNQRPHQGGYVPRDQQQGGYQNRRPHQGGYVPRDQQQGGYQNRTYGQGGAPRPQGQQGNRPGGFNRYGNQQPGQFQNRRPQGGAPGGFNRPQGQRPMGGGPRQEATPQPTNERDRSRKKNFQKKDQTKNKSYIENKANSFEKNFIYKKKEKQQVNSIPDTIDIIDVITISDLAKKMNLKANILISKLMELGTMVTINNKIDAETAAIVASEFNCKVNIVSLFDETVIEEEADIEEDMITRPPIVTVMGHVDHGKTKLLDAIRHSCKAAEESGGITQHIGAYNVVTSSNDIVTFIDTPGHEAFTMMRARGAHVTDIVILVVAADDGVMPQTTEAINHAKQANVPVIVAINKIDKPTANPDKVKQQLSELGLLPEEWGGQTMYCEISALKQLGIDELLEAVLLQADVMDLKASEKVRATGFVIESRIDQGRGVVVSLLVSKGVLTVGDYFVAGIYSGKVRAMYNDRGKKIKQAGPSIPVEITGLDFVPNAGDPFNVTVNEKEAKSISSKRQELNRMEDAKSVKKLTLQDFMQSKKTGEQQEIKVIIKADVQGSAEAIKDNIEKLSNSEIKLTTVHTGVGAINETDVMLAIASKAIILGFHVRPNIKAQALAEKERIEIRRYNIIYDVIEDIRASMEGMIKPDLTEELIGNIEVKQVFKISRVGTIAGCIVVSGKVKRKSMIRLIRDDVVIFSGKLASLKRYKDEAAEVFEGMECGVALENYKDIQVGDSMEVYEIKEITRNLLDVERKEKQELEEQKIAEMKEQQKKEEEELKKLLEADKKNED